MAKPALIVVTGPPGSGKTTLAHELARSIPCPAICRDEIKEGMVHAQGAGFEPGPSDPLTERTFPLFFEVLRVLLEAKVTIVAEAAFQDFRWRPALEPLLDLAELRIVRCTAGPEVSYARATERGARRAAHGDSALAVGFDQWREQVASFGWITIAAPAISVDTTDGYAPPLAAVAAFVSSPA